METYKGGETLKGEELVALNIPIHNKQVKRETRVPTHTVYTVEPLGINPAFQRGKPLGKKLMAGYWR